MKPPLVSIIIPVYNGELWIKKTIESCLNQSYQSLEVIVIDDASVDQTREILEQYVCSKQVEVFHLPVNGERSAARNVGIKNAKGTYFQYLDADDWLMPEKIKKQVDILEANKDFFAVYCGCEVVFDDKKSAIKSSPQISGDLLHKLIKGNFMPIQSVLIRKNPTHFDEKRRLLEDWRYWLESIGRKRVFFLDEILCGMRKHPLNSSKDLIEMTRAEISLLKEWVGSAWQNKVIWQWSVSLVRHYLILGLMYLFGVGFVSALRKIGHRDISPKNKVERF